MSQAGSFHGTRAIGATGMQAIACSISTAVR
jgi:hypothetical protein